MCENNSEEEKKSNWLDWILAILTGIGASAIITAILTTFNTIGKYAKYSALYISMDMFYNYDSLNINIITSCAVILLFAFFIAHSIQILILQIKEKYKAVNPIPAENPTSAGNPSSAENPTSAETSKHPKITCFLKCLLLYILGFLVLFFGSVLTIQFIFPFNQYSLLFVLVICIIVTIIFGFFVFIITDSTNPNESIFIKKYQHIINIVGAAVLFICLFLFFFNTVAPIGKYINVISLDSSKSDGDKEQWAILAIEEDYYITSKLLKAPESIEKDFALEVKEQKLIKKEDAEYLPYVSDTIFFGLGIFSGENANVWTDIPTTTFMNGYITCTPSPTPPPTLTPTSSPTPMSVLSP